MGYSPWGHKELGKTEQVTLGLSLFYCPDCLFQKGSFGLSEGCAPDSQIGLPIKIHMVGGL